MNHRSPIQTNRRAQLPDWGVYLLMGLFVISVVALGYFTFNRVKTFVADAPIGANDGGFQGQVEESQGLPYEIEGQPTLDPEFSNEQITILLLGIDERESSTGPWRTDTMMLLTIDPVNMRAGILSIPRDLWIQIPGYGVYDRVNTAHFRGDADQYPGGGGPALAMKTVQQEIFGRPVQYFSSINFNAFIRAIDHIGCIPITVHESIQDDTYPDGAFGYDPFYIEAGEHCLDGETLLKYARTRATFGGDFDRATRQQQVIFAIRDHILSTDQMPSLIASAPQVYATIQNGVNTNLSLPQMIEIGRILAEIPSENICGKVISGEYVDLQTLQDGSQVLVPDRDKMRDLVNDVYYGTGVCATEALSLGEEALREGATIRILNGTQQEGLATETMTVLNEVGLPISEIGNADRYDYTQTIITNYTGKTSTSRYIAQVLGLPESAIHTSTEVSDVDIEIILGSDYAP